MNLKIVLKWYHLCNYLVWNKFQRFGKTAIETFDLEQSKHYQVTCLPSEDSEQPHIRTVWSVFDECSMGS